MLKPYLILDTWSPRLPDDIIEEVSAWWRDMELGNDYYYISFDVDGDREELPKLAAHVEGLFAQMGRPPETILLHYRW